MKKFFIIFLSIVIASAGLLILPQGAHALVEVCGAGVQVLGTSVKTPPCVITNPPGLNFLSMDWIQKWIINPAVRIIIRTLLQATTQQIVGWIQGDSGKNVGYVKNLDQAFRREADAAGGEFLNNLTGLNLCGNFGAFLNITLRTPGLRQRLECTVSDIVRNVENFYANFRQGGWPAFVRISLEPQNTAAGAYLIALDAKVEAENRARERIATGVSIGKGFLGFQVPVKKNCIGVDSQGGNLVTPDQVSSNPEVSIKRNRVDNNFAAIGSQQLAEVLNNQFDAPGTTPGAITVLPVIRDANEVGGDSDRGSGVEASQAGGELGTGSAGGRKTFCTTEYETKTPGEFIADKLNKATNIGLDFAVNAKDFDEAIATIINALINKVITATFAGNDGGTSGEGIFDPGLSQIVLPPEENARVFVVQLNDLLYYADIATVDIDNILNSSHRSLFATRHIADQATTTLELILELETGISRLLTAKNDTLAIKERITALKEQLLTSRNGKEISNLALRIPRLGVDLNNIVTGAGIVVSSPVSTRDPKTDNLQLLQGSRGAITSTINLLDTIINEAAWIASTTATTSQRVAARAQREILLAEANGLRTLQARLDIARQNLNNANLDTDVRRSSEQITPLILETIQSIQRTVDSIRLADTILKGL